MALGQRFCTCVHQTCVWMLLCGGAAAEGDEVKSQIEKLWQEVNSLKEMQALQTGTLNQRQAKRWVIDGLLVLKTQVNDVDMTQLPFAKRV